MDFGLTEASVRELEQAVQCSEPVDGFTHGYYRYPARFSPRFARSAIEIFSEAGDTIFDPFVGGGTTLVEGFVLRRFSVGSDISSLAAFLTDAKVTPQSEDNLRIFSNWVLKLDKKLNLHRHISRPTSWIKRGYQKNIGCQKTWRIRKLIEMALLGVEDLCSREVQMLGRCLILRTGQWALDCREHIPTADEFRAQMRVYAEIMIDGVREFTKKLYDNRKAGSSAKDFVPLCLNRSVIGIEEDWTALRLPSPRLILTSAPYPGVHVLYHRWQVQGRRETPAPFWIANCIDGSGAAYYTFGDRKQIELRGYFRMLEQAFNSLARISDSNTFLVQLVAFSEPEWQLRKYLKALHQSGFSEVKVPYFQSSDGRLWRHVPNRKFYAMHRPKISSAKEVLLIHRYASEGKQ